MTWNSRAIRISRSDKRLKSRLRRTLSASMEIDPNILDYESRVVAQGGSLDDDKLEALTILYQDWVANSIRTDLVRVNGWPTDTFDGFNVPLIYNDTDYNDPAIGNELDTNSNFVSGDFSAVTGLKGNMVDKSLDTGVNPSLVSELSQDNIGLFVKVTEVPLVSGTMYDIGALPTYVVSDNGGDLFTAISSAGNSPGITPELGFLWIGRINGTNIEITINGDHFVVAQASLEEAALNILIFALNVGVAFAHSDRRLTWYGITKYMTEAERIILYNSLNTFDAAIGRPTY